MNSLWVVVIGIAIITLAYRLYAKRIDRVVIQADRDRATPATLYMDGVDFVPTSRFILYGYHFKSIAAAGPIVGVITAAGIWGWAPSIIWLMVGVSFIGWASDYSAIIMSVRNDGNSMSAVAHRLLAPRARTIMFVFIFFYLLLIGGAFVGIMAAVLDARPDVPFGIFMLAVMGVLAGWLIYRRKADLLAVTAVVVGVTLAAMALGPVGNTLDDDEGNSLPPGQVDWDDGAVSGQVVDINDRVNDSTPFLTDGEPLYRVEDPTSADPRLAGADGIEIGVMPSFVFWSVLLLVFSYLGTNLPIWRFAQPVNYIGFWITAIVIVVSGVGAVLAPFRNGGDVAEFEIDSYTAFVPDLADSDAFMPLWPMLFVTIACGAISGWHALFGSVGTSRQLEYETDALPVGGGGMFSENTLGLLSLVAVAITGASGAGAFATGVGELVDTATFGLIDTPYGTALGFGAFVVIVLTVVQLVFRVMRVTLAEWLGGTWVGFKNQHIASIIGSAAVLFLVLSGTWVFLWFLFGAANQLLAALSLLLVTIWLAESRRNPAFAGIPMVFMYVTTMAAILITGWNLYDTVLTQDGVAFISQLGALAMIVVAILLFVAALVIGYDGWKAWQRRPGVEAAAPAEAPSS